MKNIEERIGRVAKRWLTKIFMKKLEEKLSSLEKDSQDKPEPEEVLDITEIEEWVSSKEKEETQEITPEEIEGEVRCIESESPNSENNNGRRIFDE